jgi:uncharacterized protein YgbK (DUF1537 family)
MSARALIVADDLTGANTSAARMAQGGLTARVVVGPDDLETALEQADVVAVSTGSRSLPAGEAAGRVREVAALGAGIGFVAKRVDSTLRGNVGAELDALLDVLEEQRPGAPCRALVAPAFPAAGRTTEGGVHKVRGEPIGKVADIVAAQSRRRIGSGIGAGAAIVVCDAASDEDLAAIAAEAAALEGVRWVPVDPGPLAVELARALGVLPAAADCAAPLLVVGGSRTDLTARQLDECERVLGTRFAELDARRPDVAAVVDTLCELIAGEGGVAGVVPVGDGTEADVAAALGAVVRGILDRCDLGGLYVTGGDVTAAVLDALGARGGRVERELLPLVVAGRLDGGCAEGLPVVTKGGLVGDRVTAVAALEHLRLEARSR